METPAGHALTLTTFRDATVEDLDDVLDLYFMMHVEYAREFDEPSVSPIPEKWDGLVEGRLKPFLSSGNFKTILAIAKDTGRPVGFVMASLHEYGDPYIEHRKSVRLDDIFMHPKYRGGRDGVYLGRAALDWGRREGCTFAEANAVKDNRSRLLLMRDGFRLHSYEMRMKL